MRLRVRHPITVVAFSWLAVIGAIAASQADKIVPVHQEPRHRLVFESPGTRILDVQVPPGDTTLFHTHNDPILYVTMSTAQTRSQTLGREWTVGDAAQRTEPAVTRDAIPRVAPVRPGRMMSTTSYATQPLTHRVNNVGSTLFRLIGIINGSAGDESMTPSAGFDQPPELANRWFRGYRSTLTTAANEHRHPNPVVIVHISGGPVITGATRVELDKPGAFAWIEAHTPHDLRAVAESAEVVEVEVRRPPIPLRD